MAANDPHVRRQVASSGGRARVAKADPGELFAARGAGGTAANRPASLARRIVRAWQDLSDTERAEVIGILTTGLPLARKRRT